MAVWQRPCVRAARIAAAAARAAVDFPAGVAMMIRMALSDPPSPSGGALPVSGVWRGGRTLSTVCTIMPPNDRGQDWVVGDIHGQFTRLREDLARAGFRAEDGDRLFSVGDLVDRGGESVDVMTWLGYPWFHAILGNHEGLFLDWIDQPTPGGRARFLGETYAQNGGEWVRAQPEAVLQGVAVAFRRLPYLRVLPQPQGAPVAIIHAQMPDGSRWPQLLEQPLTARWMAEVTWSRSRCRRAQQPDGAGPEGGADAMDQNVIDGFLAVVVGHEVVSVPQVLGNHVYIDVGGWVDGRRFLPLRVADIARQMTRRLGAAS